MKAGDFSPRFLPGVPLNPIPPGLLWRTPRDLLHELMNDLHRGWVQDYLLRSDGSVDAFILSSPANLAKSMSFTFDGHLSSTRFQRPDTTNFSGSILMVPAFTRDDVSVGIAVEMTDAAGALTQIISRTKRCAHYSHNDRTGSFCAISKGDGTGVVEVFGLLPPPRPGRVCIQMQFDSALFLQAFAPGSVDFELLERSTVNLTIGHSVLNSIAHLCVEQSCAGSINAHVPSILLLLLLYVG